MHKNQSPNFTTCISVLIAGLWLTISCLPAYAAAIPAQLPDPDGKPGNPTKPVKVYILAGQSNMVGMGDLRGARNIYAGVYLSADPAIPVGPFQIYRVGNYKVSTRT